jgi:cobalamin synthase
MVLIPVLGVLFMIVRKYFVDAVGGYTGDILGATQQIFELLFLIGVLAQWKFI